MVGHDPLNKMQRASHIFVCGMLVCADRDRALSMRARLPLRGLQSLCQALEAALPCVPQAGLVHVAAVLCLGPRARVPCQAIIRLMSLGLSSSGCIPTDLFLGRFAFQD